MRPPLHFVFVALASVPLAVGAGFNAAFADTVKVWKWKDADGRVVYSQHPPGGKTKAEEKQIDPNRNVIESGWPPPATAASAGGSASSSEEGPVRDTSGRIARQGAGAADAEERPLPLPATPLLIPPAPPPAVSPPGPQAPPPPTAPPAIVAPPVFPSPGPGGVQ